MNSLSEKHLAKVALITGSAGRIGAQTARRLHESGMNIAIHYRSSAEKAAALKAELETLRPGSVELFQCDLNVTADLGGLINDVDACFGRLDALINNASSFYPTPVEQMSEEQWHDLVGSNMKAPLFLSQAAISLLKQTSGCIINLVDIHGFRPLKNHVIYSMAKAANAMMVKSLARELAPDIRVNGVAPGAIEWPDSNDSPTGSSFKAQQEILSRIPMQRKGEFDDIAKTIRFLVFDAPYITGQIIKVDGGRMTQQ
jgi:pteridine reductase